MASNSLKRKIGIDGTYLDDTSVFPVVPWKVVVRFVSSEDLERIVALIYNERLATEANRSISTTASDRNVFSLAVTANNSPVELVKFSAESEWLRVRVYDLEAEKAVLTEKISIMVTEAAVKSTGFTGLKAEKAES